MALISYGVENIIFGVPSDIRQWTPVDLPEGTLRWRLRYRNDEFGVIYLKRADGISCHSATFNEQGMLTPSKVPISLNLRGKTQNRAA